MYFSRKVKHFFVQKQTRESMETSDSADLLDQFINVTGVDRGRAKFYLESAAWNLQV